MNKKKIKQIEEDDCFSIDISGKIDKDGSDNRLIYIYNRKGFYKDKMIVAFNQDIGPSINLFIEDQPILSGYSHSGKFSLNMDLNNTTPAEVLELITRHFEENNLI